ncbi:MAG: hypothetical protein ACRD3Q_21745, partial [Terriglobales bacterium]
GEGGPVNIDPALHAFGQLTGISAPQRGVVRDLPFHLEMIYRNLMVELLAPIRIVFGYGGYRSELSLRTGFLDWVGKHTMRHGYGATALPSLIVCGKHSLVKLNGYPYSAPLHDDKWLLVGSSHENPLLLLIELIWTKLSHYFAMPDWFDMDLTMQGVSPLLWARAEQVNDQSGWEYWGIDLGKKSIEKVRPSVEWEPFRISDYQFAVLNVLCANEVVPATDPIFTNLSASEENQLNALMKERLVGRKGDAFTLLTRALQCVFTPDGEAVAADNNSGRLTAWLFKHYGRQI